MKILIIFLFFVSFVKLENIFYDKLEKLLNYCENNEDKIDAGTYLGISIARKILSSERNAENLVKKLQKLETRFLITPSSFTELSKQI